MSEESFHEAQVRATTHDSAGIDDSLPALIAQRLDTDPTGQYLAALDAEDAVIGAILRGWIAGAHAFHRLDLRWLQFRDPIRWHVNVRCWTCRVQSAEYFVGETRPRAVGGAA
jgi:hypothetical protein